MKRRINIHIPTKYVLSVMTFLCLLMIVLSFVINGFARPVKDAVASVIVPVQTGMDNVG